MRRKCSLGYILINKKIKKETCLLLLAFCSFAVFSQSNDSTVKKVEVIVQDPDQDSAADVIEESQPAEPRSSKKEIEYFDSKSLHPYLIDSFEKRSLPDSAIKKMQRDDEFWYANYAFEKEEQKERNLNGKTPVTERTWFQTLMWLVIIGGFAYALILYLSDSSIGVFRKKVKSINEEQLVEESENIFEINYRDRIDKAIKAGNYRLATRLMFLQMLKTMAGKNMIHYQQDHTNFDYLMQLRNTIYYADFFRITRNYEYAWYGNFPVNEEAWHIIKSNFEKFEITLSRK